MIFQPIGILCFWSRVWFVGPEKYFGKSFHCKVAVEIKSQFSFGSREGKVLDTGARFPRPSEPRPVHTKGVDSAEGLVSGRGDILSD